MKGCPSLGIGKRYNDYCCSKL